MDRFGPIKSNYGRTLGKGNRFSPLVGAGYVKPKPIQIGNSRPEEAVLQPKPRVPFQIGNSQPAPFQLGNSRPIMNRFLVHQHNFASPVVNDSTNRGQYRFQKTLGKGAFGTVFQADDNKTKETVAIKIFTITKKFGSAKREINLLGSLNHPNVVAFKQSYSFKERSGVDGIAIVMEYCANGSLKDHLSFCSYSLQVIKFTTRSKWYQQLSSALSHIHDKGIAHRDLKPENILLDGSDNIKVADVGIAKAAWECTGLGDNTPTFGHFMTTVIGTKPYMAPEVYGSNQYGLPCDVFSLGLVFWMIAEVPSSSPRVISGYGKNYLGEVLRHSQAQGVAATSLLSPSIRNSKPTETALVNKMLHWDARNRPTIHEVSEEVKKLKLSVVARGIPPYFGYSLSSISNFDLDIINISI